MTTVAESHNRYFWLMVLVFFFPYIAIGIEFGFCTESFWLNLALTLFVPLGGSIHGWSLLHKARYSDDHARDRYASADVEHRSGAPSTNAAQRTQQSRQTQPVSANQPVNRTTEKPAVTAAQSHQSNSISEKGSTNKTPAARTDAIDRDSVSPVASLTAHK